MTQRQFDLYAVERDWVERTARIALWLTVRAACSYYWAADLRAKRRRR